MLILGFYYSALYLEGYGVGGGLMSACQKTLTGEGVALSLFLGMLSIVRLNLLS
jgi:hypothetical protein